MNRKAKLVLEITFVLAVGLDALVAFLGGAPGLTSCPPFTGAVHLTLSTSGLAQVSGPLFSGTQLILAPGSTGTVTLRMTSGFNITEYFEEINRSALPLGPFGADNYVIDVSKAYRTSTGWNTYGVSPNATGISVSQVSFVKIDDHNYTATYKVEASPSAPPGVYQAPMFFNGWCSTYYLTVGNFPYVGTIDGSPQFITLLLPLVLFFVVWGGILIYERRKVGI